MPCVCPSCSLRVPEDVDCIACDYCNKWYHLECTELSKSQFDLFSKDKSFTWFCEKCSADKCKKCNILTKGNLKIKCDLCEYKYHLPCAGLNKKAVIYTPWFCFKCNADIFPFNDLPVKKLLSLSFNSLDLTRHPNKFRRLHTSPNESTVVNYAKKCNCCSNLVAQPNSAIPCPSCKCLIHQSCSKLKRREIDQMKKLSNIWECPACTSDKYPYAKSDDIELHLDSFNSNWSGSSLFKPQRYIPSPTSDEFKLILNRDDDYKYNEAYLEDFDENFETYHSLKPDFKYYETEEFITMKDKASDSFSLLHTNICSLQYNGDNLQTLLAKHEFKFDVIALTETWNPEYKKHSFQPPILPGYKPFKGTNGSSLKGGCGMYINEDLKPLSRPDLNMKIKDDDCEIESYWTEILIENQPNRLIGVFYRHPTKNNDKKSIELINETLTKIRKENKKVIITGDFNYDLLKHETDSTISDFLQMMIDNSYQPCITEPTRIVNNHKPSLVDNIYLNSVETCLSGNLFDKISDHLPSFVILQNVKSKPKPKVIQRRNMKNFDALRYQADLYLVLQELEMHKTTLYKNAEVAYNFFHKKHSAILHKHAPMEFLTRKQVELELKPWITKGILNSTRVKSKLFKLFKKTKSEEYYARFKFYRDTINSLLRKSKKQYFKQYFSLHAHNIKKTWKGINNLLHRQGNSKVSDIFLNIDGKLFTDQKIVVDKMNNYFVNVADNLAKKIPKPDKNHKHFLKNPNVHSLFLTEIGPDEIHKIIKELGVNKSGDIYGNTPNLVKLGGPVLIQILTLLFNKSIDQGIFPNALKLSKIVPIHKGDSIFEMSNYRPISLLPIFSKILEKLMYSRVIDFITKYNILYTNQFGFQKNMSTEYAINSLLQNIVTCLNQDETGFCILLDFAKAFDTVNHEILLDKLHYYGIRGTALKWFQSYLKDRMQCTEIGNTQSDLKYIKCGVPQGSILGPLLFLLYINDIVLSSDAFKFTLFADDTSLFYSHKNVEKAVEVMNFELAKIAEWLAANKLSLNVGKSKLLVYNNRKKISINITLNGQTLKEVDHAKYLGVLIDNKLNWSKQISAINLKISKGLGLLAKSRHYVPSVTLRSLYFTFVNSHVDYNHLNWGMAAPSNLKTIHTKINKALRIMSFKDKEHPSDPLYKEFNILPLEKSFELKNAKHMWKLHNGFLPTCLSNNFQRNSRNQVSQSISRLDSLKRFSLFTAPKVWNELPQLVKSKPTLKSFSKAVQNYLLPTNNTDNIHRNNQTGITRGRQGQRFQSRWDLEIGEATSLI